MPAARGVRHQAAGRRVDGNSTFSLRTNATKCELAAQASSTPYAAASAPLPATIERKTFADFLTCGDPAHGFVHLRCTECEHERAVAFSCKRRGVCTSCAGRRMNEVAQHLTRNVLPYQGIRQWVLSLPYSRRYRLAYDRALVGPVLDAFVRAIFSAHRRRVRTRHAVGRHVELAAAYRDKIVPTRNTHMTAESSRVPAVTRLSWAVLLRRTFAVDALACPRCGGRMRPVGVVTDYDEIDALLARTERARAP